MDEPETNNHKSRTAERTDEPKRVESVGDIELEAGEAPGTEPAEKPGFLEGLRQSFKRGWQANGSGRKGTRSRQELRKDKTKTLLGLAAFAGDDDCVVCPGLFIASETTADQQPPAGNTRSWPEGNARAGWPTRERHPPDESRAGKQ